MIIIKKNTCTEQKQKEEKTLLLCHDYHRPDAERR